MKSGFFRRKYIYIGLNVVVSLLLFVLVLISPASAFLWATSYATSSIGDTDLANATVSLDLIETSEKQILNFKDTPAAIEAQVDLLGYVDSLKEQTAVNEYFTAWRLSDLLAEGNSYFEEAEAASQFSILQRSYTFKNSSSIPVYFRINRAVLTNDDIDMTLAAFWSMDDGETLDSFAYEPISDCYYLKAPLLTDDQITVTFAAMILDTGDASGSFDFVANFAEIIQATNNAVYMAKGWQYFAKEFLPYDTEEDDKDNPGGQGNQGGSGGQGNQGDQGGNPGGQGNQGDQGGNPGGQGNQGDQGGNPGGQGNQGDQGGNPGGQGNQGDQGGNPGGQGNQGDQGGNPGGQGNQDDQGGNPGGQGNQDDQGNPGGQGNQDDQGNPGGQEDQGNQNDQGDQQ